jgi:hypothetical protein
VSKNIDPDQLLQDYVALCNDSLRDRPPGVTVAMHFFRGNYKAHFLSQGGYETVADLLFNGLAVGCPTFWNLILPEQAISRLYG